MKKIYTFCLLVFLNFCFGQNLTATNYDNILLENYNLKRYDSILKYGKNYLQFLKLDKDVISKPEQILKLEYISEAYEKLGKIDSAVYTYDFIIKNSAATFSNSFLECNLYYKRAKLKISKNDINGACEDLDKAVSLNADYLDYYKKAVELKQEFCKNYTVSKVANTGNNKQIKLLSLFLSTKKQNEISLGKPTKKETEYRGKISYDCYVYNTKNGIYKISYINDFSNFILYYPTIKQKFNKSQLWNGGGVFETENDQLKGFLKTSLLGSLNNNPFYDLYFETDYNKYTLSFYSDSKGTISKVLIF